ncbi:MAG: 3-phosphoshikimate 1-carboxyvinyltransferase [Victivallales bacterium]|nr:3-phosphoshikimate 1-carboxyvinyltransferase [Victivallales bacterium]
MTSYTFSPFDVFGCVEAIPSKSVAHRVLIAAALADVATDVVLNGFTSADIEATIRCIKALGAIVQPLDNGLRVVPGKSPIGQALFDCGESGSTLRFMLPVAAARLPNGAEFIGAGRLPNRPLGELCDGLRANGCNLSANSVPLTLTGRLTGGEFQLPGNVSSQYITGLLLALPITPRGGCIRLTSQLESSDYVTMTLQVLEQFGIVVERLSDGWRVPGGQTYRSPGNVLVEGDWSNAAALLCAGAIDGRVTVRGMNVASAQGDRRIMEFLRDFGAKVAVDGEAITVASRPLHGVTLDISENPDLFPVLAVVAAAAEGRTVLANAKRVRMKECDRLSGMAEMLTAVGANVTETEDSLIIDGGTPLHGAHVNVHNDHRLVMAAVLLSLATNANIEVDNVEAVNKSFPCFLDDWKRICRL